jgi:hypothetical protein
LKTALFISIFILACLGVAAAVPQQLIVIHNQGTLAMRNASEVTLTVYNDTGLKTMANLTGIGSDWFSPSSVFKTPDYSYRTLYGILATNTTENATLNIYTENWNPAAAQNYIVLFAYRNVSSSQVTAFNGTTLQAPAAMEISLALYIPTGANKTFTFDILFNTIYVGEP